MPTLNYAALAALIAQEGWWFDGAELHGILSAFSAFNQAALAPNLLAEADAQQLSEELLAHCDSSLQDNSLTYQLLLSDEEPLFLRAESLVNWCQGFLLAYQFMQEQGKLEIKDESIEQFIAELREIAELDIALADNEDNARQLTDIEEHCRLGVLMIYAEYHR